MTFNLSAIQKLILIYVGAFIFFAISALAEDAPKVTEAPKATDTTKAAKAPEAPAKKEKAVQADNKLPKVVFETSMGNFTIELDEPKAPITVKNFLQYVDEKFYDKKIFHRVIPTFMIQGGGMDPDMKEGKTHTAIKNEAKNGLKNKRGTVAMARTGAVDSATAQFFINVVDNPFLDHSGEGQAYGYAVFGKVTEGMDTVDKIKAVKTSSKGPYDDVPVESVVIKTARRK